MTASTTTATPGKVDARRSSGIWRDAFGRLDQEPPGDRRRLFFIIFLVILGIFGPRFAPWPYDAQDTPGAGREQLPAPDAVPAP